MFPYLQIHLKVLVQKAFLVHFAQTPSTVDKELIGITILYTVLKTASQTT